MSNNIIDGVTKVVIEFCRVIVMEDDLLTSPNFLQYMYDSLNKYESTSRVVSIAGYMYPIKEKLPESFFLKGADCLG
jgi:hypothetical protein